MNILTPEKHRCLIDMLHDNQPAAVIADKLRINRRVVQQLRLQFISKNNKSLFMAQKTTLAELSPNQLLRLKTLVSLDASVGVICASFDMTADNVRSLIEELKS